MQNKQEKNIGESHKKETSLLSWKNNIIDYLMIYYTIHINTIMDKYTYKGDDIQQSRIVICRHKHTKIQMKNYSNDIWIHNIQWLCKKTKNPI